MITDRQGKCLRINPAFSRVTGYTPEEAIGKTPRILKSRRQDEQLRILAEPDGKWRMER